jgi:hypothetical protein
MRQQKIHLLNDIYYTTPTIPLDHLISGYDLPESEQYWRRERLPDNYTKLSDSDKNKISLRFWQKYYEGHWFMNNGEPCYMPPKAWFFVQNFSGQFDPMPFTDSKYPQFRIAQNKRFMFREMAEKTKGCLGTITFKQRRDGLTSERVSEQIYKGIQAEDIQLGIISQNDKKAKTVCWAKLIRGFKKMPPFFRPKRDGSTDPKTMLSLKNPAKRITKLYIEESKTGNFDEEDDELNVTLDYRATSTDAYDGDKILDLLIDEFAKFRQGVSPRQCFETHRECITQGSNQIGHIHIISSPREEINDDDGKVNPKALEEMIALFKESDTEKAGEDLITSSRLWAYFSPADESFEGVDENGKWFIDKYGYCDKERAREYILNDRKKSKTKESLRTKTLQHPLYLSEIFDSGDTETIFTEVQAIRERKVYLQTSVWKDEKKQEPCFVYGNYEWKDGLPDTSVYFKPSQNQSTYSITGRCKKAYDPSEDEINRYIKRGDKKFLYRDNPFVMGIDPYDYKRTFTRDPSKGAGVVGKCFDFFETGNLNALFSQYLFRPKTPNDFYEDMIKMAVYHGASVQFEAKNMNIADYFEDRGYFDFLMNYDIKKRDERKGNPATADLTSEMATLIDQHFSIPIEGDENNFDTCWFEDMLQDLEDFDPMDTKKSHITMALGQMLLGFKKRKIVKKPKVDTSVTRSILEYLTN